ncbi:hypothetical protein SDC9_113838 [bioreactor metagenome]|uniref:Uncharacterized protein n=1 Tax=bioreactor metagenome TaxID=1076179 RepID=A0A645BYY6_9ZZZZ
MVAIFSARINKPIVQGIVIMEVTLKAVFNFALIPVWSFIMRDSEIAGTRLIASEAVRIVERLIKGTAIPVR